MQLKSLLPLAALALAALAPAASTAANSVVVRYGDLNLNSQAGIARLHKRISNAAVTVCEQLETRILGLQGAYRKCVDEAVAHGVAAVANDNLNHFHASKGKATVLASNR